nr:MAG TPA: hypothetical protein [Caudoviricetes sp.]
MKNKSWYSIEATRNQPPAGPETPGGHLVAVSSVFVCFITIPIFSKKFFPHRM